MLSSTGPSEPEKAKDPEIGPEAKVAPPPVQAQHQRVLDHLAAQIQRQANDFDPSIYNKYRIKKYLLSNEDKEPVEVWIYDESSLPLPVLEDQAEKRLTSLLKTAEAVFKNQGRGNDLPLLAQLTKKTWDRFKQIQDLPLRHEADFKRQLDEFTRLIQAVLNDVGYLWLRRHARRLSLGAGDYRAFEKEFWHTAEQITPAYKKNNILTINYDPEVRTVQYYERGTLPPENQREKQYRSAHNRGEAGIPNFAVASAGYISRQGRLILTSPGNFSHASLPPRDLYKKKAPKGQPKNYYRPECVAITTQNMLSLEQEFRSRLEAKDERPRPDLSWLNVSVMTVHGNQKQDKLYHDTIVAADRIRSRDNSGLKPIIFNFGVNIGAVKKAGFFSTYPDEQKFENQRAFFQLQEKLLASLKSAVSTITKKSGPLTASEAAIASLTTVFSSLKARLTNFQIIEDTIKPLAQAYDQAMKTFEEKPTEEHRLAALRLEKQLGDTKEQARDAAQALTEAYNEQFKAEADNIHSQTLKLWDYLRQAALNRDQGTASDEELQDLSPPRNSLLLSLLDLGHFLHYYCNDTWRDQGNNFLMQSSLASLGENLGAVDCFYPPTGKTRSLTTVTYNCVSRNDRSAVLAAYMDQIRAIRDLGKVNPQKHFVSSATCQVPVIDTDGGGPKFGGNIHDPKGHPYVKFSKLQAATSDWANHKLSHDGFPATPEPVLIDLERDQPQLSMQDKLEEFFEFSFKNVPENVSAEKRGALKAAADRLQQTFSAIKITEKNAFLAEVTLLYLKRLQFEMSPGVKEEVTARLQSYVSAALHSPEPKPEPLQERKVEKEDSQANGKLKEREAWLQQKVAEMRGQVNTCEAWLQKIKRDLFSFLEKPEKGFSFSNFRLRLNTDSTGTVDIKNAYLNWEKAETSGRLMEQIDALQALNKALSAWIHVKQNKLGSQLTKSGDDWRNDTRLPANLALQEFVVDALRQRQQALCQAFVDNDNKLQQTPKFGLK